jgi:hypothetical protein
VQAPSRPASRFHRLVWWHEFILIGVGYWVYSLTQGTITSGVQQAMRHGWSIARLEHALGVNVELAFNHFVVNNQWLAVAMNYYYMTAHFIVTSTVLVWLYKRHPQRYRGARTALISATMFALVIFWVFPVAPPRLLPALGYLDTGVIFHTFGAPAGAAVAAHSNQFAAMPSLHTAWALWCGVTVFAMARRRWVRLLGLAYPMCTVVVIVGTANHFLLDAVGGAGVLAIGYVIQRALSGHGAYAPGSGTGQFAGVLTTA